MKFKKYPYYKHSSDINTLKELVRFCSDKYNENTAFMYKENNELISVSFIKFRSDIEKLTAYIIQHDYRNSKIAIFGDNSYEWILSFFSITCSGNIAVPVDKALDAESIEYILNDSDCSAIFYSDDYEDIFCKLNQHKSEKISFYTFESIQKVLSDTNSDYQETEPDKQDIAAIVYTSGTTGKSKGVMLTHENLCSSMYGSCCNVLLSGTSLLVLPLHHMFGLVAGVLSVLFYGHAVYINTGLRRITNDFKICKPEHMFAVPLIAETIYNNIINAAKKQGKDRLLKKLIKISDALLKCHIDMRKIFFRQILQNFGGNFHLIISGGAPLKEEYINKFHSLGITLLNGYGITECGPVVAVNRNDYPIPDSVGLPLCCNDIKISESDEILVKGSNVMKGYYKNEAENNKVFTEDGWFRTGDIGFIDEYGALHITGRIKNLIILSNGENISAETIEEKIYTIPYVKEVIVYEKDGMIAAEIYLDNNYPEAGKNIESDINTINKNLPLTQNINKIIIRDSEFPKTTTRKIKRNYKD